MERSLLIWRFFTLIMVTDCVIEFCPHKLPQVSHATYKALTYKIGTLVISPRNRQTQATPKPDEQKKGKNTEMQSQMQPTEQVSQGHCREPPPWEHESSERIYHFMEGQIIHYECAQGFRALQRGPAKITCKMICGAVRWTQPQLKCIREGDEEPQASTDTSFESATSCPLIMADTTTEFEKQTEVTTTPKMFVFTTEYQIAVAVCVLLLISILLLSLFTWQQRRRKNRRTI
ncbi:interleukin-2 receptor subunit alpha isoform X3 [Sturnira hondurensis]|uniref:interleukin-2 receptor subunit alpha isoform X3 n=1 Tax=Sturnira hondurensis TaxID=192404 RepID=UPI001879CE67|nr:interleukin-2 receptor subunit alpha isoform X3 [Sturnira hondurensis]